MTDRLLTSERIGPWLSDTQYMRVVRRLRPDFRPRTIIVRVSGLVVRVEVGSCAWCAAYDGPICSACGSKADRARASLARTAAKRDARISMASAPKRYEQMELV